MRAFPAALLLCVLGLCPPRAVVGQSTRLLDGPDGYPFRPPLASAIEPGTRLAPVRIHRGSEHRTVGLANFGDAFAVWLSRGSRDDSGAARPVPPSPPDRSLRLAIGLAGGAFARFDLQSRNNEFREAHFRVGLQLRAGWRGLAARAELYHVSSHLGDEYMVRTGALPHSTSREGVEILVQGSPLHGLILYGGPGSIVRSKRNFVAASVRAGFDWEPTGVRWGPFAPYAGVEAFSWAELGWDPILSGQAGVRFGGGRFRLGLDGGAGPSRAEQFWRQNETLLGVVFTLVH
ncbi:MAG: DUF1207 domain-containing protein [Candidatus Palauibacterales bacterium]|nr:DUF1207 domain-containing protein [Candidatus Palauibacterales bacterium]MDP2530992.1 DUF1207 domain-containing protein [Candidatus Palauibacterales bacterium]MDP2583435.1 DUF1207 domain-containing protein [Candidatus Palauibacterales bacterium]